MFENYSLSDFFANIYKKKWVNVAVFALLMILAVAFSVKTSKVTVNDNKEKNIYSRYVSYNMIDKNKITDDKVIVKSDYGYGEFYGSLLMENLNGSYLFGDLSEDELEKLAKELDVASNVLRNANADFFDKKVKIKTLYDSVGVVASIVTISDRANEIIEKKFDKLIETYKNVYSNVSIEKNDTVKMNYVDKNNEAQITEKSSISIKSIVKKMIVAFILIVILISVANIIIYIFNPTINYRNSYSKYGIKFIYDIDELSNLKSALSYKSENLGEVAFVSTDKTVIHKFEKDMPDYNIFNYKDISNLIKYKNVVVVEEYGVTRYKKFEEELQNLNNIERNILGIISYKL